MRNATRIAVITDFEENRPSHVVTQNVLKHTAGILASEIEIHWLPTEPFEEMGGCSLEYESQEILIEEDSLSHKLYGKEHITEQFNCNYSLNEQ